MTTVFAALQDALRDNKRLRSEIDGLRKTNAILVLQRDKLMGLVMERDDYAKATNAIRSVTQGDAPHES